MTFCYSTIKKHDLKRCIEENIAKVGSISEPVLMEIEKAGSELQIIRHMLSPSLLTHVSTNMETNSGKEADLNLVISKLSIPILRKIESNEKELREMKRILQKQSDVLPVIERLDRYMKELSYVKNVVSGHIDKVIRSNNNSVVNEPTVEEVEQYLRNIIWYGSLTIVAIVVVRAIFG